MIRNEASGTFPHKMIRDHYGGEKGFWNFLKSRKNDNCLMGCSIKGNGKEGPQVVDGTPTGLILNHAYALLNVLEIDNKEKGQDKIKLVVLRNPWGRGEWEGSWSGDSKEIKEYKEDLEDFISSLPPDE